MCKRASPKTANHRHIHWNATRSCQTTSEEQLRTTTPLTCAISHHDKRSVFIDVHCTLMIKYVGRSCKGHSRIFLSRQLEAYEFCTGLLRQKLSWQLFCFGDHFVAWLLPQDLDLNAINLWRTFAPGHKVAECGVDSGSPHLHEHPKQKQAAGNQSTVEKHSGSQCRCQTASVAWRVGEFWEIGCTVQLQAISVLVDTLCICESGLNCPYVQNRHQQKDKFHAP